MYRTLAFNDETEDDERQSRVFSLDSFRESKIETFQGHKTSKRTLLVCSLILIATTGLLATWVFVARPRFYPKLGVFTRSSSVISEETLWINEKRASENTKHREKRTAVHKYIFKVEIITDPKLFPINDSRLPLDLLPEQYFLNLTIELKKADFQGSVKITLKCRKSTNHIIFHGRRIELLAAIITNGEKKNFNYKRIMYIKHFEMFIIEMENSLEEGKMYEFYLEYSAGYGKTLAGLYKSYYKSKGKKQVIIPIIFNFLHRII